MLRAGVLLRAAAASPVAVAPPPPVKPLRVLVLTMVPDGGAMTEALRLLGYHPYTFQTALRKGRVLTHPQEWVAVLRREKPFNYEVLQIPEETEKKATAAATEVSAAQSSPSSPAPRYYDSLVGPPATAAFESILRTCPRSTRVVLVEEPDKLAWEKDMEALLHPLAVRAERSSLFVPDSRLHSMLRDMVDLRRTLIGPAALQRSSGRPRAMPSSSAAMTAHNVPLGQQQSVLRLSGALDLFEQHVKEVVPADRLLVYRVEQGWQPLCDFLQVPVPTFTPPPSPSPASTSSSTPNTVAAAPVPLPFPAHSNGGDIFRFVDEGLHKANMLVLFIVLSAGALGLLMMSSFWDEMRSFYRDLQAYVKRDFDPYLDKERQAMEAGEAPTLTTHQTLFIAKKSAQRFSAEYEEKGGAWRSMSEVLRRFTRIPEVQPVPPATAPLPAETEGTK